MFLPPPTKLGQDNFFRSMCQEFCPRGGGSPGPHPGGRLRVWPGGSPGSPPVGVSRPKPRGVGVGVSQHAMRQTPPPQQAATAGGSTHPTGMHSCHTCYTCLWFCSWGGLCPGGLSRWGGLCPGGLCLWGSLSQYGGRAGGAHPTGMHSCYTCLWFCSRRGGVSVQGVSV